MTFAFLCLYQVLADKVTSLNVTKVKNEEEELTTMSDHQSYCNSLSKYLYISSKCMYIV